jgi:hypothetical protein
MPEKLCCFPGCTDPVSKGHLACWPHWRSVGADIQRQVQWRLHAWKDENAAREYLVYFFRKQTKG